VDETGVKGILWALRGQTTSDFHSDAAPTAVKERKKKNR